VLENADNITGVRAIIEPPIIIGSKVTQANAKVLSVAKLRQSLGLFNGLNLG
jgi:hypothetical protein